MFAHSQRKLLVCLNQGQHSVVIRTRVLRNDVALDAATGTQATISKFSDEFVLQKLGRRRGLDELGEEFRRYSGFFDARREFVRWRQRPVCFMTAGEVVLIIIVERRRIKHWRATL